MRLAWAVVLLVGLASQAQGQAAMSDPVDSDPAGLDVVVVGVAFAPGTATMGADFAGPELPQGAALRGVVLIGEPGTPEPAEWYQFTIANETHVFAAHGTPHEVHVVASSWANGTMRLEFARSDAASASCIFAVVESGTFGAGGFERVDVAPRGFASMETAWPVTACPADEGGFGDDAVEPEDEKGSPGLGSLLAFASLGLALALRRR